MIGKGGFGAVYAYEEMAMKIIRLDLTNLQVLSRFYDEVLISKQLSEEDSDHAHFPQFAGCFLLGQSVSPSLDQILAPPAKGAPAQKQDEAAGKGSKLAESARADQEHQKPGKDTISEKANYIFVGILMEKLEKNLFWFLSQYSSEMDLLERARMALNLAEHLAFMNDSLHKNHCDVKPDNFMLNRLTRKPKPGDAVVSAYTLFFNDFMNYKSKLIDFGGTVRQGAKCVVNTVGFVPFDDLLMNGSIITPLEGSDKNDVFAFGSILAYALTRDRPLDLMKMNISFHLLVKGIISIENEVYKRELAADGKGFREKVAKFGWQAIRNVTIPGITGPIAGQMGDFLTPLRDTWQILSDQTGLTNDDFIKQIFSAPDNLLAILETIYQSYFATVKEDRTLLAKFEMLRLFASYKVTPGEHADFVADVDSYVEQEQRFVDLVQQTFTFSKSNRAEWAFLIEQFKEIEEALVAVHLKVKNAAKAISGKKNPPIDFETYSQFMAKVKEESMVLPDELTGGHGRILAQSSTESRVGAGSFEQTDGRIVVDVHEKVLSATRNQMMRAIENNAELNGHGVEYFMKRTEHQSQINIHEMEKHQTGDKSLVTNFLII